MLKAVIDEFNNIYGIGKDENEAIKNTYYDCRLYLDYGSLEDLKEDIRNHTTSSEVVNITESAAINVITYGGNKKEHHNVRDGKGYFTVIKTEVEYRKEHPEED